MIEIKARIKIGVAVRIGDGIRVRFRKVVGVENHFSPFQLH